MRRLPLLCAFLLLTGCYDSRFGERSGGEEPEPATATIAQLRQLYAGTTFVIATDVVVSGRVNTSDAEENFYRTFCVEEDGAGLEVMAGIDQLHNDFPPVTDLLGKDELIDHQNELVSFKGMTVEAAGQDADGNDVAYLYNYDGSGSEGDDLYFNVSLDGETYTFTVESYLCDKDSDVYKAVEALNIGDKIDMEGFLYWYEGVNPHITSVTAAE